MSSSSLAALPVDFGEGGAYLSPGASSGSPDLRSILDAYRTALAKTLPNLTVRGVITANVASLAAFTVAAGDGVTYAAGDSVLLAGQTTAAQCGVYVVGTVTTGVAPLTRHPDQASGDAIINGTRVEASEGTIWAGSSWKAMCTGANIYGTNDPVFYPKTCKGVATLVAGAKTLGSADGLFLFSTTASVVMLTRNTANTSTATTGGYTAPVASRTAGKPAAAACLIHAEVAAGTANASDLSTIDWLVTNW